MRLSKLLFSLMFATFILSGLSYSQTVRNNATMGDELSYTEDQTWFAQQRGWSEVTQSGQRQPWRQATWEEQVNQFISALRKGDRRAFLVVEYPLLGGYDRAKGYPVNPNVEKQDLYEQEARQGVSVSQKSSSGVLDKLMQEAKAGNTTVAKWLTEGDAKIRANVVQATLSGLTNKDPRVRLVAANLLRRLRPDASMAMEVKRALALETVTTPMAKWRPKDIDIPSIENPRLGWKTQFAESSGAPANYDGDPAHWNTAFHRDDDGGLLNGIGKGTYLVDGLYKRGQRNDYQVTIDKFDVRGDVDVDAGVTQANSAGGAQVTAVSRTVWTKASLLRYGADEQESSFETEYGFQKREVMPRYLYDYIDYRHPSNGAVGDTKYEAYHSVWEEMKKLDLFITRAVWTEKVKKDINSLRYVSKDTFRSLADQIDGESLEYVPMKSPGFRFFAEPEYRAIIVGMLENRVVSTREECVRFLKRLFSKTGISTATKREIKKALREARRRELIIDTIRGRHLHNELVVAAKPPDEWWGEKDEIDTSEWATEQQRQEKLREYRNQVEYPEETDIIYHDRRKPGQEDEGEGEGDEGEGEGAAEEGEAAPKAEGEGESASKSEGGDKDDVFVGHPLLVKNKVTLAEVESYLLIEAFLKSGDFYGSSHPDKPAAEEKKDEKAAPADTASAEGTETAEGGDEEEGEGEEEGEEEGEGEGEISPLFERSRPGQSPGTRDPRVTDKQKDSATAQYYETMRAIETLNSMLNGDGAALIKASYRDVQHAMYMLGYMAKKHGNGSFLEYLLAGASVGGGKAGTHFHSPWALEQELARADRLRASYRALESAIQNKLGKLVKKTGGLALVEGDQAKTLTGLRNSYLADMLAEQSGDAGKASSGDAAAEEKPAAAPAEGEGDEGEGEGEGDATEAYASSLPGRSVREIEDPKTRTYGQYYGEGKGGYYRNYDQQKRLTSQAENDPAKLGEGFYRFDQGSENARRKLVDALLVGLDSNDPQKRLLFIHLLRRMIPDQSMMQKINKLLREMETVDRRPYKYSSTYLLPGADMFARQEKIVSHELLKLQRFILRRVLVDKIRKGNEPEFLQTIAKGAFLTLVVRIDAEWDPFRIPLRTPIMDNEGGNSGMFFTAKDVNVIKGGLENKNFLVQRETARWLVSFYEHNYNRVGAYGRTFVQAIKRAESKDIIYYERNYVQWRYKDAAEAKPTFSGTTKEKDAEIKVQKGPNVVGIPVGRVAVRIGSNADREIFKAIDQDRKIEYVDQHGRDKIVDPRKTKEAGSIDHDASVKKSYRELEDKIDPKLKERIEQLQNKK